MRYRVVVEKDGGIPAGKQRRLRKLGLRKESDIKFSGTVRSDREAAPIRAFCARNRARFYFDDKRWLRSSDYRDTFFRSHEPVKRGMYRCVYCGRLIRRSDVTVDHIYPVAKASSSIRIQKKLIRKGIKNINDKKNLVPACWACNRKKSTRTGLWVIRAKLGTSELFWFWMNTARTTAAGAFLFAVYGLYRGWLRVDLLLSAVRTLFFSVVGSML